MDENFQYVIIYDGLQFGKVIENAGQEFHFIPITDIKVVYPNWARSLFLDPKPKLYKLIEILDKERDELIELSKQKLEYEEVMKKEKEDIETLKLLLEKYKDKI